MTKSLSYYPWRGQADLNIIFKLNKLTNPVTFWDEVRRLTRRITSDHSLRRWQRFAEIRFTILTENGGDQV